MENLYGCDEATSAIMLQGFKWDPRWNQQAGRWYECLQSKIKEIVEAKISIIWLPPCSKSREQNYMGYTPMDYYDLGEFQQWVQYWDNDKGKFVWKKQQGVETFFGKKKDLLDLLKECHKNEIKCIADIILNHREAQQVNKFSDFTSWAGEDHAIESGKMAWGKTDDRPPEISFSYRGAGMDDGEGGFAANIDHNNLRVKGEFVEWLLWLKELGFDGWRYDFVKGFSPKHILEYNEKTSPYLSVGEHWDSTENTCKWIDKTNPDNYKKRSMAFDFDLKWLLNEIFWGRKNFQELGSWRYDKKNSLAYCWPSKAITFLDNHDTDKELGKDFPKDDKRLVQGHVFLLTHPGLPCLFWSHLFETNKQVSDLIKNLCRLRVEKNITNQSDARVIEWKDCYAAEIDNKIIVKIGDSFWSPETSTPPVLFGEGWAIWEK